MTNTKNRVIIGKNYTVNNVIKGEVLVDNREKEVLVIKGDDDSLIFALGNVAIVENNISTKNTMEFGITLSDILDCITEYHKTENSTSKESVIKAIRSKYYKIPTYLAEEVAEWYLR